MWIQNCCQGRASVAEETIISLSAGQMGYYEVGETMKSLNIAGKQEQRVEMVGGEIAVFAFKFSVGLKSPERPVDIGKGNIAFAHVY